MHETGYRYNNAFRFSVLYKNEAEKDQSERQKQTRKNSLFIIDLKLINKVYNPKEK